MERQTDVYARRDIHEKYDPDALSHELVYTLGSNRGIPVRLIDWCHRTIRTFILTLTTEIQFHRRSHNASVASAPIINKIALRKIHRGLRTVHINGLTESPRLDTPIILRYASKKDAWFPGAINKEYQNGALTVHLNIHLAIGSIVVLRSSPSAGKTQIRQGAYKVSAVENRLGHGSDERNFILRLDMI